MMFGSADRKRRLQGQIVCLPTWGTHNTAKSLLTVSSITVKDDNQSTSCQRVGWDLPASNSSQDCFARGFDVGGSSLLTFWSVDGGREQTKTSLLLIERGKAAYWGNDSSSTHESIRLTYEETLPEFRRNSHTKQISRWESDLFGVPPPHRCSKTFRQMKTRKDLFPNCLSACRFMPVRQLCYFLLLYAERQPWRGLKAHLRLLSSNVDFIVGFERHLRPPSSHLTPHLQSDASRVREQHVRDKAACRRGRATAATCGWLPTASLVPSRTIPICQAELILN